MVGKTWVYLVHKRGIINHEPCPHGCNPEVPQDCPKCHGSGMVEVPQMAIFSAFVPQRVEMPIWESQLTDERSARNWRREVSRQSHSKTAIERSCIGGEMIKLISLCQEPGGLWYIDFSDYEERGGD